MAPAARYVCNASRPVSGIPTKFTRSLPAKAIASANVPNSTTIFRTFTFRYANSIISKEKIRKPIPSMVQVPLLRNSISSGVCRVEPFSPFISRNHRMQVMAIPANIPTFNCEFLLYVNVNKSLESHCTRKPKTNATATDRNIASIIVSALSEFSSSFRVSSVPSAPTAPRATFTIASANAPPNNSNTNDTVVDVGIPRVL